MKNIFTIIFVLFTAIQIATSQQVQSASDIKCGFNSSQIPDEVQIYKDKQGKVGNQVLSSSGSFDCMQHYVIPVVFHVFADNAATTVPLSQVQSALDILNRDINGLNDDYDSVDPYFLDRRDKLNITFALATIDPDGNSYIR